MDNLEFKTLIKENKTLHNGMRGGVKSLYESFYSEEYIPEDIYRKDDDDLTMGRLVTALQDRVKLDPKAFSVIIRVLRATVSMDKLADMLEERLSTLQIEAQRNKETQDRKKRELEDLQAQRYSSPIAINTRSPQRPTELDTTAVCRDVVNTGPAGYGHRHTPIKFQKSGGQASSLGTGVDIISPRNIDFKKWYPSTTENEGGKGNFSLQQPIETATEGGNTTSLEIGLRDALLGLNTRDSEFITGQGHFYDQIGTGGDGDYAEKEEILNDDRDTMQNMAGQERGERVRYATDSTCQNSILLGKGNKTITCKSNSPEVFQTPRGSPEPSTTSSPLPEEPGQSVSSGDCDHCFKLRRTLSELHKKLKELEERGEVERISNHSQITAYKKELNNITLENYALKTASSKYHERHLEQENIIFQLSTTIDNISRRQEESEKVSQQEESEKVSQLTMELEKVKVEKEREREEKYREKADKERERREKDQEREEKWKEREEKEEEREEKERVKRENVEIKRRNTVLEMKIQQMYAQYHRASSLQCSSEDGTWPDDDVEVGEEERRDDRVPPFHPATSDTLSTYMPPPRQANTNNYTTAATTTNYTTTPGPAMDPRDYHSTSTALQSNTNAGGDYTTTNTTTRGPQGNANNGDYYVPPTSSRGPTSSHSHSRSTAHHHQQQQLPAYNHHGLHPAAAQQHARDDASTNSMDFNRHKMH